MPGIRLGALYTPSLLEMVSRTTPVATFLMVILALGSTAPLVSVTLPLSVPPATWALRLVMFRERTKSPSITTRQNMEIFFGMMKHLLRSLLVITRGTQ